MTENEFATLNAQGKIKEVKPREAAAPASSRPAPLAPDISTYLAVLELLQRPRLHLTSAPTFIPKNFAEQIQFYDDGAGTPVRRVYFYVNGGWRYVALT